MLWHIIVASIVVSSISLVSVYVLLLNRNVIQNHLKKLISAASGVLLASVFLELLPEGLESSKGDAHNFFFTVLASIIVFFLVERVVHWHHCHGVNCPEHNRAHVAVINLLGDGIHNFVDGVIMGAAFLVSPVIGLTTTAAIIAHEIPQEISDASVLLYAGLSKAKVICYNLLFSGTALLGALLAYFFIGQYEYVIPYFIAVASGNFIYLSLADLVPELHHDQTRKQILMHGGWLIAGVLVVWLAISVLEH